MSFKVQIRTPSQIGGLLKAARNAAGIRQEELSLATGKSVKFISQIENGKAYGSLASFLELMQAAGARVLVELPSGADGGRDGGNE